MMSTWEFVLVYLLVFVLVQLAVYRYLRRQGDDEDGEGEGPSTTWVSPPGTGFGATGEHFHRTSSRDRPDGHEQEDTREPSSDGSQIRPRDGPRTRNRTGRSGRRCPNCGTHEADEMYTFCRNCVSRLPG